MPKLPSKCVGTTPAVTAHAITVQASSTAVHHKGIETGIVSVALQHMLYLDRLLNLLDQFLNQGHAVVHPAGSHTGTQGHRGERGCWGTVQVYAATGPVQ